MLQLHAFTFSPLAENTYVLWNEKGEAVIIDPGCYHSYEKEELRAFLETNKLMPTLLLNTHCHLDHVFGEKWVAETWNLTPYIHTAEQFIMRFAESSGQMWGVPFINYTGPFHFLEEGQVIPFGDNELNVLFVPGHSPGHLCFYSQAQGFVIAGDTLFAGSVGRTDLPGGSHNTLIKRIKSELLTLPDETIIYPGHGPVTTVGKEKKSNPYVQQ